MNDKITLYSTTNLDHLKLERFETIWKTARPIWGRHIGYDGGSGFKIMVCEEDQLSEARAMDAQPIMMVGADWEAETLAGHEYAKEYGEMIEAGDMTLREVVINMGYRHVEITPVDA